MAEKGSCLIIEDDDQLRETILDILAREGFSVRAAASAEEGIESAESGSFDVILSDISLPGKSGIEALGALREAQPDAPVILVTAFPSVESAIDGMRAGAFDYVTKPFHPDELLMVIERALAHHALELENRTLRHLTSDSSSFAGLIGKSPAIRDIVTQIHRIASSRSNVLLSGECGTGKDVIARAIHHNSSSGSQPMVAINCSAIPDALLESELFGHVKGAFTGAIASKRGLFEEAGRGTLFLDEITELPLEMQAKLLRVLQSREVRPVGGNRLVRIGARIIAATNKNPREEIDAGRFRQDLFYRLNVIPIHVPPLRDRVEDIPLLVENLLGRHSGRSGEWKRSVAPAAMALLLRRPWEGNVRELENVIERALVLTEGKVIQPEDLPLDENLGTVTQDELHRLFEAATDQRLTVRQLADQYIAHVVKVSGGNKAQAAKRLGVAVRTLYRRGKDSPEHAPPKPQP